MISVDLPCIRYKRRRQEDSVASPVETPANASAHVSSQTDFFQRYRGCF